VISLLNFGDSPFYFLFVLVAAIFAATLFVNFISAVLVLAIKARTRSVERSYGRRK
jgi:hypothetical protein